MQAKGGRFFQETSNSLLTKHPKTAKNRGEALPFFADLVNTWSTLYKTYPPVYLTLPLVTSVPTSNAKYLILLLLLFTLCYRELLWYCIQGLVGLRLCGFESRLRHHKDFRGLAQFWLILFCSLMALGQRFGSENLLLPHISFSIYSLSKHLLLF